MNNDNDIKQPENAGEQTDTCGLISSPAFCYTSDFFHLSLMDCMEGMRAYPDKYFDLAIVDPPYGIGYERGGQYFDEKQYGDKKWDTPPNKEYFDELMRVSKNQIIWGSNYYVMPPTRCVLAWVKTAELQGRTFSEHEIAWTSFNTVARYIELKPFQRNGERIHPTQKPVKLYEWLLKNYAKEGDKILDTHLGSGSSVIACYNLNYHITGYEIDADYFTAMKRRIEEHMKQQRLFG